MYSYYQVDSSEEKWKLAPYSHLSKIITEHNPMYTTVLAVDKIVEDLVSEDRKKLKYFGGYYADFDSSDKETVITKFNQFLDKLVEMRLDLAMVKLFLTGGKGMHIEIPSECFVERIDRSGTMALPTVYREMSLELFVDTLDLRVYSQNRGRMWRCVNKLRPNGKYKVPVTADEVRALTPDSYDQLCSQPRTLINPKSPELCIDLSLSYSRAAQKVGEKLKKQAKAKPDPDAKLRATCPSIGLAMMGQGLKPGAGFQFIAMQLAISANTAGVDEATFLQQCEGIIENHEGDGSRYNSPDKRRVELSRMWAYTNDNPMYEFSIGAIKALLNHPAPDLDGIAVEDGDIEACIAEANAEERSTEPDEYADLAAGVTLSKYGVYVDTEFGKKRVCGISFEDTNILFSIESETIVGYDTAILVNGKNTGRMQLTQDVMQTPLNFNKFCSARGHAYLGSDLQLRGVFMRFIEQAKKKGGVQYVTKREGLDVLSIPNHANPELRKPFLVWADNRGVLLDPRVSETDLHMIFQGDPDPKGVFRTDLGDAPKFADWLKEGNNRTELKKSMFSLLNCQTPEVLAGLIGWYTACFWRMLFHRAYDKFPILHVAGQAGSGKCLGKGTPVVMYDGTRKLVENVVAGDRLMGPDGQPRNVISTTSGTDNLYKVQQNRADAYVVNSAHILSLKLVDRSKGLNLADGTNVPKTADVVNVPVEVYFNSNATAKSRLKGWKCDAVEFGNSSVLPLDPYWFGAWIGDGVSNKPALCKPTCKLVDWWVDEAQSRGHEAVNHTPKENCGVWNIKNPNGDNYYTKALKDLGVWQNKHIPDAYLRSSVASRLKLLAGLLDSDGNINCGGYRFSTVSLTLAKDVLFVAQSVGLRATLVTETKFSKVVKRDHTMHFVFITGTVSRIPCLDKPLQDRAADVRVLVQGIEVTPAGFGEYYGFQLDGDKLFLLGDFTVTHNTEMNMAMQSLFYNDREPISLTPSSSPFAISQQMAGSSSLPLMLDEYKVAAMGAARHEVMKQLIRDSYQCRDVTRGGGSKENDNFRTLNHSQLASPLMFIAEAAEEESAVMERVILLNFIRPPASVATRRYTLFQQFRRNKHHLAIIGQYIASQVLMSGSIEQLRKEFDPMYEAARNKLMLTEANQHEEIDADTRLDRQNAKERTVFNYTVGKFGFRKFREVLNSALDNELDTRLGEVEESTYNKMRELQQATLPEYLKVLAMMASMTYAIEDGKAEALRKGYEYAFVNLGNVDCVEIAAKSAYFKYRQYCKICSTPALYPGHESFMMALRNSEALKAHGNGKVLNMPQVFTFDVQVLSKLGVDVFKP